MPAGPVIVLIEPQLGENIGSAARAMANGGLTDMRLVRPRDGWPNSRAKTNAAGALDAIDEVRVYETTQGAIADLTAVYATTARSRGMIKRVQTPAAAIAEIHMASLAGGRPGILFGPERTGLDNDDVALADAVITVPLNPAFTSLNLAQAVMILGYEWMQSIAEGPQDQLVANHTVPASKADLHGFFEHLEGELDEAGFLGVPEKRPSMIRNIRNIFERAALTEQEIKTLHGVVTRLVGARMRRRGSRQRGPDED